MLNNFSFNDAYRLIANVIDERIKALTRSGAGVEVTWGTVASVDTGETCSAYLFGEDLPSSGLRLENGLRPNVGDPVRISIDKRGNRWVDAILSDATLAHPKLEIKPREGVIKTGNGLAPATPLADQFAPATIIADKPATDAGTTYPIGVSTHSGTIAAGWPFDFALITTIKLSEFRILQICSAHNPSRAVMRSYHDTTGWFAWSSMTPETVDLANLTIQGVLTLGADVTLSRIGVNLLHTPDTLAVGGGIQGSGSGVRLNPTGSVEVRSVGGAAYIDFTDDDVADFDARVRLYADRLAIESKPVSALSGLSVGTTAPPPNATSILIGSDVVIDRTAANVATLGTGDRIDQGRIGRHIAMSTPPTIPSATATRVQHDTLMWSDSFGTTASLGSVIINVTGLYMVTIHGEWPANSTGSWRIIGIGRAAGAHPTSWGGWGTPSMNTYAASQPTSSGTMRMRHTFIVPLTDGDYIAQFAYQNSGAGLLFYNSELVVARIAA